MQDQFPFCFYRIGATATPAGCPGRAVTTTGKADNHSLLALRITNALHIHMHHCLLVKQMHAFCVLACPHSYHADSRHDNDNNEQAAATLQPDSHSDITMDKPNHS